jgi:sigma-B regulation protein RsbU (phosphoserine phosphatase)
MATVDNDRFLGALQTLLERVHLATPGQVPDVVAAAAAELGWTTVMYFVDYEQRLLVPISATGAADAQPQMIEGTLAGRAFKSSQPVIAHGPERAVWAPVFDGVHRLGVMRITVPEDTDLLDPMVERVYRVLTQLAGHLVAAKMPYGDALARVSRNKERTVASELLWDLLPPLTFGCEGLIVSGILEPCYDVAADAFDYSVVDDVGHLAVFDGMGHDLNGTIMTAVALAALRNSRREGRDLDETVRTVDRFVTQHGNGEVMATGVIGQLDLPTGRLRYVNAGHPSPLLVRRGKVVKELNAGRRLLFGYGHDEAPVAQEFLEPGDWVVFYTDGITEARDAEGSFFGLERLIGHLERSAATDLPAPESLRRLSHDVLDHQGGVLQDDATLVIAQWSSDQERRYSSGAAPSPRPMPDPNATRR